MKEDHAAVEMYRSGDLESQEKMDFGKRLVKEISHIWKRSKKTKNLSVFTFSDALEV